MTQKENFQGKLISYSPSQMKVDIVFQMFMQQKEGAHLVAYQIPAMEKFEDRPMSPVNLR